MCTKQYDSVVEKKGRSDLQAPGGVVVEPTTVNVEVTRPPEGRPAPGSALEEEGRSPGVAGLTESGPVVEVAETPSHGEVVGPGAVPLTPHGPWRDVRWVSLEVGV